MTDRTAPRTAEPQTIALIGLGAMGSRMAAKLLGAGHRVLIHNRTPEKARSLVEAGAVLTGSPRAAAEQAQIVISMVTDDAASKQVWLDAERGALVGLQPGSIAMESSTLTVEWTLELARRVEEAGRAQFLDAPVVGSRPQAEAGQLVYLVGGRANAFASVRDLLALMGGAQHHVGAAGQGMLMKLVVNAYFGIQVAALGELLGLIRRSDVEPTKATEILTSLPIMSPALKAIAGSMNARAFTPLFPIDLVEKDLAYAVTTGEASNARLPTTTVVRDVFAEARRLGLGGDNISGVAQVFEPILRRHGSEHRT